MIVAAHIVNNGSGTDPGNICLLELNANQVAWFQKRQIDGQPASFKISINDLDAIIKRAIGTKPPRLVEDIWTIYYE